MRSTYARWVAVLAALALLVAACGDDGEDATADAEDDEAVEVDEFAELAMNPTDDREEQLLEAAIENGGEVLVYTTLPVPEMEAQIEGFNEHYPEIEVDFYRGGAGSGAMISRILTEAGADALEADVVWTNDHVTYVLDATGELVDFVSVHGDSYDEAFQVTENSYPSYINYWMWSYNTELLDESELPRTYDELLEEQWHGQLSLATYPDWFFGLWEILGDDEADAFFSALGDQDPALGPQFTPNFLPVIQGERSLTISMVSGVLRGRQDDGAPVEGYFPDETTVARTVPIANFDQGGNPEGGLLFTEYVLSEEGQDLLKQRGRVPGHIDVPPDPPELLPDDAVLIDYSVFIPDEDEWTQRMDEYLGQ